MARTRSQPPARRGSRSGGSTALATKDNVRSMLVELGPQMADLLPRTIDMKTMVAVCLNAIEQDSKLLDCSPRSFFGAIMECGRMGLYPDGVLGHAHLIPFKGRVQLITGYKGKIHLAITSGQVADVSAYTVHEGDRFEYEEGTKPFVKHKTLVAKHPDTLTHAYATAILKAVPTLPKFAVIDRAEIDRTKLRSPGGGGGTWESDYVAMARKTAIHRLCTTLQLSPEHARATALDTLAEAGISQNLDTSPLVNELPDADKVLGEAEPSAEEGFGDENDVQMPEETRDEAETRQEPANSGRSAPPAGSGNQKGSSRGSEGRKRSGGSGGPTEPQIKRLFAIGYESGWDRGQIVDYVDEVFGKKPEDLTREEYDSACKYLEETGP